MPADPAGEAAAELYGLPLEDFTPERDARAKALRKAGDREAAAAVAKLRKPSRVAWVVDQLAREGLDDLLEAGAALRAAQLEGGGDLRGAARAEREAVEAAVRRGDALGLPAGGAERLRATLHALAGDDELRALVEAGRLVKEPEGGGAWPVGFAAAAPERDEAPAPEPKPEKPAKAKADGAAERRKERAAQADREREERAARKAAARERQQLERRLKAARAAAERAAARLAEAREEHEAACDEVARLEERLG